MPTKKKNRMRGKENEWKRLKQTEHELTVMVFDALYIWTGSAIYNRIDRENAGHASTKHQVS